MELLARVPNAPVVFAALAVALLAAVAVLAARLKSARAQLAEVQARVSSPRMVESRRERYGLLWFPTLTLREPERLIVSAAAGVPHCARCLKALTHTFGVNQEWTCGGCGERRPGSTVDLMVTDSVIAETVHEFIARNPGYRAADGLPALKGA